MINDSSETTQPSDHYSNDSDKPKKSKKVLILVILFFLLSVATGWYVFKAINPEAGGPRIHPLSLVPNDAHYVFETDQPYELWSSMSQTRIWDALLDDPEWKEYGVMMKELESSLSSFDRALDILANRTVYVSTHTIRKQVTDLLYIVDLEGLSLIQTWMNSQDHVTKRTYANQTIYEKLDVESGESYYYAFINNYLVLSYTHTLIEAAINSSGKAELSRSLDFIEIKKTVIGDGMARLYVNYNELYPYLDLVVGQEEMAPMTEGFPFLFSGFYFDVQKESLLLEGYSSYADSLFTYLNVFKETGQGKAEIAEVLPSRTSIYFSFGFKTFNKFYQNLVNEQSLDQESDEMFNTYTKRTEKFLGIDMQEDVIDWIDDEMAFAQFESDKQSETVFILKAKDKELAQAKMEYLSLRIKRRTPVKFKSVPYRDHQINFMAVKGLFKLILGNLFNKVERPYYTIIDKYVVFGSTPQALRRMIDSWYEERNLSRVPAYQSFVETLGSKHNLLLYSQLELLSKSKNGVIDEPTLELIESKSSILSHFPQFGFNITSNDKLYNTKMLVSTIGMESDQIYDQPQIQAEFIMNLDSLQIQAEQTEQLVVEEIETVDFGAKSQSENYEDGAIKYELDTKDGLKHGNYFEYYPTGELKIKGKFKEDQKDGTWKYYLQDGSLEKKEKYKDGELKG